MLLSSRHLRFITPSFFLSTGLPLVTLLALGGCKSSGVAANGADVKAITLGWNESHDVNSKEAATAAFGVNHSCFAGARVGTKVWVATSGSPVERFAAQQQGTLKKLSGDGAEFTAATTAIFDRAKSACGEQLTTQATTQTQSSYSQFIRDANNSAYVLTRGAGPNQFTSILFAYTNENHMPELMQLDNGL